MIGRQSMRPANYMAFWQGIWMFEVSKKNFCPSFFAVFIYFLLFIFLRNFISVS